MITASSDDNDPKNIAALNIINVMPRYIGFRVYSYKPDITNFVGEPEGAIVVPERASNFAAVPVNTRLRMSGRKPR